MLSPYKNKDISSKNLHKIRSNVESLYRDSENNLWIGNVESFPITNEKIFCITEVENNILLGTENDGLFVLNNQGEIKHHYIENASNKDSIKSNSIWSVFSDKEGRIWLGYYNQGVDVYDSLYNKFFENINGKSKIYTGLKSNIGVESLFLDSNNNIIWMASFLKGLHYYDPKNNSFYYCDTDPFISSGLIKSDVKTIIVDSEDKIWAGTIGGLFRIEDLGDSNFHVENLRSKLEIAQKNHPSLHNILSLYEAKDATIWIGTDGAGLFRYDRNEDEFYNQNLVQDIEETSINGIIEDNQNNIWISGSLGITKFSMLDNTVTNFTVDDGLLSHYFHNGAIAKGQSGTLYFGNQLGINYINPKKYETNKIEPTLYFTDFKLFNKSVIPNKKGSVLKKSISETDTIELTYNQTVFSINYIGVNYTRAEKNEYAYFLEGFDKQWNFVGNSKSVTYTSLNPGEYTFKVKASNNDGVWTQNPLMLYIRVTPPWWKSNLAYASYIFFTILCGIGIYLFSKKRFKEKQNILFERNKRIQEEELHTTRLQFFTNISHEFRTPLTLIINPIKDLIKNENLELSKRVKTSIK